MKHLLNFSNFKKFFYLAAFTLGITLITINFHGSFTPIDRHSGIKDVQNHKITLRKLNQIEAKKKLEAIDLTNLTFRELKNLNSIFASSIVHFWPKNENYFYLKENWLIFGLQKLDALPFNKTKIFGNIERFNWEKVVESGYGLCSQVSLSLYDYLTKNSIETQIVRLEGHVVLQVRIKGRYYILDPDYNATIEGSMDDIYDNPRMVGLAYIDSGYTPELSENMVEKYIHGNKNWIGTRFEYYPKLSLFHFFFKYFEVVYTYRISYILHHQNSTTEIKL